MVISLTLLNMDDIQLNLKNFFKNGDLLVKCRMYGKIRHTNSIIDQDCEYMYQMIEGKTDRRYAHIDNNYDHYMKLFVECPFLKNFPVLRNTIIAGGFINIAIDDDLSYTDFKTSDIDIFVTGDGAEQDLVEIFDFFDDYNAEYKQYYNIINVYLPNYSRNFQVIWQDKKDVFACISRFHSSHVKCGLYNGKIYIMPDCEYTIHSKIALIDENSINAYTMQKIMKRGYIPFNYENYIGKDLSQYPSVTKKKFTQELVENATKITSKEAKNIIKKINFNRKPQIICPEIIQMYNL